MNVIDLFGRKEGSALYLGENTFYQIFGADSV